MIRYVDHTYRDFSRYIDDGGELVKHKKCDRNFPSKVHEMLSDETHSDAITWMQPHGRAFKIIDKDLLMSSVLPEYIVCKKYESFARQLNAWGFKRLYKSGPDLGYHECFLRGLPKLTTLIRRLPPNQGKATPYPAGEPNFYDISKRYPLLDSTSSRASEPATAAASMSVSARDEDQGLLTPSMRTLAGPMTQNIASGALGSAPFSGHSHGTQQSEEDSPAIGRPSTLSDQRFASNMQYAPSVSTRNPPQEYSGSHGNLGQQFEESSAAIERMSAPSNPNLPSNMHHTTSFSMRNPPQDFPGLAASAVPAPMAPMPRDTARESFHEITRTRDHPHHQPAGHTSFSHAPSPSTFYQASEHNVHYPGNSYSQYSAQAPLPQYQYSAPNQQQYQPSYPPQYYHGPTGYYRAPTGEHFQQPSNPYPTLDRNFSHPSRGIPDAEQATPQPYSVSDTNCHLNEHPWQSHRQGRSSSINQPPVASLKPERDAKEGDPPVQR